MRRKKDDKQVLIPRSNPNYRQGSKRPRMRKARYNKRFLLFIIFIFLAFIIGAAIGVSLIFDDGNGSSDGERWINVTEEMTTNLNDTEPVYYDDELDDVDFNSNETRIKLNLTDEPSY